MKHHGKESVISEHALKMLIPYSCWRSADSSQFSLAKLTMFKTLNKEQKYCSAAI